MHCFVSIFISHRAREKYHLVTKNKIDNPAFVNEEDIPMVHQDDDYDDYTSDTGRVDETSFMVPATTEATLTLRLRQKLKRDKIECIDTLMNQMIQALQT